jgi:hypothetical protein
MIIRNAPRGTIRAALRYPAARWLLSALAVPQVGLGRRWRSGLRPCPAAPTPGRAWHRPGPCPAPPRPPSPPLRATRLLAEQAPGIGPKGIRINETTGAARRDR